MVFSIHKSSIQNFLDGVKTIRKTIFAQDISGFGHMGQIVYLCSSSYKFTSIKKHKVRFRHYNVLHNWPYVLVFRTSLRPCQQDFGHARKLSTYQIKIESERERKIEKERET